MTKQEAREKARATPDPVALISLFYALIDASTLPDEPELKPCPFCGHEAQNRTTTPGFNWFGCRTGGCPGGGTWSSGTVTDAMALWNWRGIAKRNLRPVEQQ